MLCYAAIITLLILSSKIFLYFPEEITARTCLNANTSEAKKDRDKEEGRFVSLQMFLSVFEIQATLFAISLISLNKEI